MNNKRDLFRLGHVLECCQKIKSLISKVKTFEKFKTQWIYQDAMVRNLEIIGEASNHISEELKSENPDVHWNKIRGMRNIIIHEYFGVRLETIWGNSKK